MLEQRLIQKIKDLYEMLDKYRELNKATNGKYRWRSDAIEAQIDALEQLRDNEDSCWYECYIEDCRDSGIKK